MIVDGSCQMLNHNSMLKSFPFAVSSKFLPSPHAFEDRQKVRLWLRWEVRGVGCWFSMIFLLSLSSLDPKWLRLVDERGHCRKVRNIIHVIWWYLGYATLIEANVTHILILVFHVISWVGCNWLLNEGVKHRQLWLQTWHNLGIYQAVLGNLPLETILRWRGVNVNIHESRYWVQVWWTIVVEVSSEVIPKGSLWRQKVLGWESILIINVPAHVSINLR